MVTCRAIFPIVFGLILPGLCCAGGPARAYSIVSGGVASTVFTPAADTITLNAASISAVIGSFALQSGVFTINNSGTTTGTFTDNLVENITIDGETQALNLLAQDIVGISSDTIKIFASQPVYFLKSNTVLTTRVYNFVSTIKTDNFTLTADLVPEPSMVWLFWAALIGLEYGRRRAAQA